MCPWLKQSRISQCWLCGSFSKLLLHQHTSFLANTWRKLNFDKCWICIAVAQNLRSYEFLNEHVGHFSLRHTANVKRDKPSWLWIPITGIPTSSPSGGGDVAMYVFDINQSSLPTPFYSVLESVFVFMALSTVFHSINFPNNSSLSHSVLPVIFLSYWSFQLYIYFVWKSPSALI